MSFLSRYILSDVNGPKFVSVIFVFQCISMGPLMTERGNFDYLDHKTGYSGGNIQIVCFPKHHSLLLFFYTFAISPKKSPNGIWAIAKEWRGMVCNKNVLWWIRGEREEGVQNRKVWPNILFEGIQEHTCNIIFTLLIMLV